MKMSLASVVLCDKNVLPTLKGKFYRMVVRPTLLYGSELASQKQPYLGDKVWWIKLIRNEVIWHKVRGASVYTR